MIQHIRITFSSFRNFREKPSDNENTELLNRRSDTTTTTTTTYYELKKRLQKK